MASHFDQSFQDELSKLNEAQKSAVEHLEGPVLVIAGPGTGKTQILSARIGYILSSADTQARPHNILCLTYTDAGTIAMRKRLLKFIGPEAYKVHIHTFHSFCNQVIQENLDYFGFRELQPITELESILLFKELIDDLGPKNPLKRYTGDVYYEVRRLQVLFNLMKKENWTPELIEEKIKEYLESLPFREDFIYKRANAKQGIKAGDIKKDKISEEEAKLELLRAACQEFPRFESMMRKKRRYDYNDMILWVLEAFRNNEEILRRYQEQYLYFLVDEYQDTNGAQNEILNILTGYWDKPNIFAVGDDDQSIYRFQGASVKNIIDFYDRFKEDVKTIVLTENYRSSQNILNSSAGLINFNEERLVRKINGLSKDLYAKGSFAESEVEVNVLEYYNVIHEEAIILNQLIKLYESGEDLSEVAVIYRSHKIVDNLVRMLETRNIPLNVRQQTNILNLPFVESLVSLLTYLSEEYARPHSAEFLLYEIMHYNFFSINTRDIARIARKCYESKESWREVISSREKLFLLNLESARHISALEENLSYWIKEIPNITLQTLFEKIIIKGGIMSYIMNSPDKIWLMQVVNTFFDFIKDETAKDPSLDLPAFLSLLKEMKENGISLTVNKVIQAEKGINFVTAHSSKGLEFRHVFLISCTSSNWEKQRARSQTYKIPDTLTEADTEDKTEEERRLFYVAMTRAKEYLHISYAARDNAGKELEMSRFVAEVLESEVIKVKHPELNEKEISDYQFALLASERPAALSFTDVEFMKDSLKNYKMSVTHLNKFLSCPLSFYFENVLRVPSARSESMGFGNAMHSALYMLFSRMSKSENNEFPTADEFYSFFSVGMYNHRSHFTDKEYERRLEFGKELLYDYYAKYVGQWNKIVTVEHRINNTEVEGVPITGALDKIEFDGKKVNVVDYKTGNPENGKKKLNRPSEKDPNGGDYWRQIVFYRILLDSDKSKNYEMLSGEIDFLQKDSKKEFIKEKVFVLPEDIEIVKGQIKTTYDKIMNLEFTQGCNKEECYWCNFVKHHYRTEIQDSEVDE